MNKKKKKRIPDYVGKKVSWFEPREGEPGEHVMLVGTVIDQDLMLTIGMADTPLPWTIRVDVKRVKFLP